MFRIIKWYTINNSPTWTSFIFASARALARPFPSARSRSLLWREQVGHGRSWFSRRRVPAEKGLKSRCRCIRSIFHCSWYSLKEDWLAALIWQWTYFRISWACFDTRAWTFKIRHSRPLSIATPSLRWHRARIDRRTWYWGVFRRSESWWFGRPPCR